MLQKNFKMIFFLFQLLAQPWSLSAGQGPRWSRPFEGFAQPKPGPAYIEGRARTTPGPTWPGPLTGLGANLLGDGPQKLIYGEFEESELWKGANLLGDGPWKLVYEEVKHSELWKSTFESWDISSEVVRAELRWIRLGKDEKLKLWRLPCRLKLERFIRVTLPAPLHDISIQRHVVLFGDQEERDWEWRLDFQWSSASASSATDASAPSVIRPSQAITTTRLRDDAVFACTHVCNVLDPWE